MGEWSDHPKIMKFHILALGSSLTIIDWVGWDLMVPGCIPGLKSPGNQIDPEISQNPPNKELIKKAPSNYAKCIRFCLNSWFCPKIFMAGPKLPFLNFHTIKVDSTCPGTICARDITRPLAFQVYGVLFHSFGPPYIQKKSEHVWKYIFRFS